MGRLKGMNELLVSGFVREQKNLSSVIPSAVVQLFIVFYHEKNVHFLCDPNCIQDFESDPREDYIHDIINTITTQSKITNKLQAACISTIGWNNGYHRFKIKVIETCIPHGFAFGIMHITDMSLFETIIDYWHVYNSKCIASYEFRVFDGDVNGLWVHHNQSDTELTVQQTYNVKFNDKKIINGDELTIVADMTLNNYWSLQFYINDKLLAFDQIETCANIKLIDKPYYPVINMLDTEHQNQKFEILECF